MTTPLRSNLEPGSSRWATRRAQWRALGLSAEDLEKPKIAIVNSSSGLAICYSHLDAIAQRVREGIAAAGGVGFEIRTAAPSDFITSAGHRGGYILSGRDLIVNDIEVAVEGALLDGMVCLASCDKTAPGQLMAAGRLDVPTIVVACGYQPSGVHRGKPCDIEEVFLAAAHAAGGGLSREELTAMTEEAVQGPGVCAGMGTANSMHMACEALGMALPGTTPVLANSPAMWDAVDRAARRIVELVAADVRPRRLLTPGAFANAVTLMLAVSGSINTVKHLQAIAREAGCGVDVYEAFARDADRVPVLTTVRPNGDDTIAALEDAGGARAVLKALAPLLDTSVETVAGQSLDEVLAGVAAGDPGVIRPLDRPVSHSPTIRLVRGTLAPAGGIAKVPPGGPVRSQFAGPARVYASSEDAVAGIRAGEVEAGQVLVVRGIGPKGSPGMGMASQPVFALDGAGLGGEVALVTDGQLSGLVNTGLAVAEVSPEAADGGPLALVEDGDPICLDLDRRRLDLEVPDPVLRGRRPPGRPGQGEEVGWLSVYQQRVRPLQEGATLRLDPSPRP